MTISNFFFDEDESRNFLEEFGIEISYINADGALIGVDDEKIYGVLDRQAQTVRDDTGGIYISKSDILTVYIDDGKKMLNSTEIRINTETWRPRKNAAEIIDDGSLMVIPLEKI